MCENHSDSGRELRQLIVTIGRWFDGFGKFAMMMNRGYDERMSGESNMIQRLAKESHKIDLYLKEKLERYRQETICNVQQRLIDSNRVGEALSCTPDEFWKTFLTEEERQVLPGGYSKEKVYNLCIREPIEALFQSPHCLSWLNDDIGALLLEAAVKDGVVTIVISENVTPVVMDGRAPRLIDAATVAEMLDCVTACSIDFGGFCIEFGVNK